MAESILSQSRKPASKNKKRNYKNLKAWIYLFDQGEQEYLLSVLEEECKLIDLGMKERLSMHITLRESLIPSLEAYMQDHARPGRITIADEAASAMWLLVNDIANDIERMPQRIRARISMLMSAWDELIIRGSSPFFCDQLVNTSQRQSRIAKKPRALINSDNGIIKRDDIIKNLALSPKYVEYSAKELWPLLQGKFEELGLSVRLYELMDTSMNYNAHYEWPEYDKQTGEAKNRHIRFKNFQSIVSGFRKANKKRPNPASKTS